LARDLGRRRILGQRSGSVDRCERKAAGRADKHVAPRQSIAVMFGHCSTSDSPSAGNGPGVTVS
jgi:hypothetical protein